MADLGSVQYSVEFSLAKAKSSLAAIEAEADAMASRIGAKFGNIGFGGSRGGSGGGGGAPSGSVSGSGQPAGGGGGGAAATAGVATAIIARAHEESTGWQWGGGSPHSYGGSMGMGLGSIRPMMGGTSQRLLSAAQTVSVSGHRIMEQPMLGDGGGSGGSGSNMTVSGAGNIPPSYLLNKMEKTLLTAGLAFVARLVGNTNDAIHATRMETIGAGADPIKQQLAQIHGISRGIGAVPIIGGTLASIAGGFGLNAREENLTVQQNLRDFGIAFGAHAASVAGGAVSASGAAFPVTNLPGQLKNLEGGRIAAVGNLEAERKKAMLGAPQLTKNYQAYDDDALKQAGLSDWQISEINKAGAKHINDFNPYASGNARRHQANAFLKENAGAPFAADIVNVNSQTANQRSSALTMFNLNLGEEGVQLKAQNLRNQLRPGAAAASEVGNEFALQKEYINKERGKLDPRGSPDDREAYNALTADLKMKGELAKAQILGQRTDTLLNVYGGRPQEITGMQSIEAMRSPVPETNESVLQAQLVELQKLNDFLAQIVAANKDK